MPCSSQFVLKCHENAQSRLEIVWFFFLSLFLMKDEANLTIHLPYTKLNVAAKCKIKPHVVSTSHFASDLIIMCISNVQRFKGGSTNDEEASMFDPEESVNVKLSPIEGIILEPVDQNYRISLKIFFIVWQAVPLILGPYCSPTKPLPEPQV